MGTKKIDWRIVGIALMPALGLSIGVVLLGGLIGLSDPVGERVSQLVFFPVFLAAYVYIDRRRSAAHERGRDGAATPPR